MTEAAEKLDVEQSEAGQTLLAMSRRKTGEVPAEILVGLALRIYGDTEWPPGKAEASLVGTGAALEYPPTWALPESTAPFAPVRCRRRCRRCPDRE